MLKSFDAINLLNLTTPARTQTAVILHLAVNWCREASAVFFDLCVGCLLSEAQLFWT